MKFLCPSCKAKYQIADEKVVGRTLRMACRQCKEDIVIRGDSVRQGTAAGTVSAPPSRLGADFQRQVASGSSPSLPPAAANALDQWHVAINDVPVGPMRRDEVARKIAAGAVSPESLAWREGLDDWLPVRHIAELAVLCPPAAVAPTAAAPTAAAPTAAAPTATPGVAAAPPPAAVVPPGMSLPPPPPAPPSPATRGAQVPVGGSHGAAVPALASAPVAPPAQAPAAPAPAVEPAPGRRSYAGDMDAPPVSGGSNISWAQMFLLVCGGAFILAMGALLGAKMLSNPEQPQAAAPPAEQPAVEAPGTTTGEAPAPVGTREEAVAAEIELDLQEIDGEAEEAAPAKSAKKGTTSTGNRSTSGSKTSGSKLTQAQKDMLARMGGGTDTPVGNIRTTTTKRSSSGGSGGGSGLNASQLSKVVSKGKRSLQRCYESALRGAGSDDAVRLDISLTISAAGNVKTVRTSGKGLPGMDKCILRTVKAWRFPKASSDTTTKFPVVFAPGG